MENTFKCTLFENGIGIELGAQKFVISFDEAQLPWDDAEKWCQERGGTLPGIDQLMTIYENREEINAALESAEKETLGGWYWSNREHSTNSSAAWFVSMNLGNADWDGKDEASYVRAVSAFPSDIE